MMRGYRRRCVVAIVSILLIAGIAFNSFFFVVFRGDGEFGLEAVAKRWSSVKVVKFDYLKNISRPFYHIVNDPGFKVDRKYFSMRGSKINDVPHTFSIPGAEICDRGSPATIFIVPSVTKPGSADERLEIRRTWASSIYDQNWRQSNPTRLAFFFGSLSLTKEQKEALEKESATFGDIVVGDFVDSYRNLSLKMATAITWAAQNCPSTAALVKVDMDTYVDMGVLLDLINVLPVKDHPNYIFGYQHAYTHPLVVRTGAWEVPEALYPFNIFPRYIYGHSYVISGPAVQLMAKSFPKFPIVPNEDAFVTGIMAVALNITRFYHQSFAFSLEKRYLCQLKHHHYASAIIKWKERMELWKALENEECLDKVL